MVKMVMRGNEATALGAKLCRPQVIPAYPITPSTMFPERISEYIADGELDSEFVLVESEHSAMSAAIGAAATGVRVVTATASQGLELMHEMLFIASGMRLPIIMAVGNRALSAPINIWCDHQDTISARDCGWIQMYAERNQEALDLMIMAFKIGENKRVLLPTLVGLDAFVLTHTQEIVDAPSQEEVDKFLPPYKPTHVYLDPKRPISIGSFGSPDVYMEFRFAQDLAMSKEAPKVIDETFKEWEKLFGRKYEKVTAFQCKDADIILVTMGSMTGTARETVKKLRAAGKKVGLCKITVLRPFPDQELKEILKGAKVVAVADRSLSLGYGGPVYAEIASSFINDTKKPLMQSFIIGLGGRDVLVKDFETIFSKCETSIKTGKVEKTTDWINVNYEPAEVK
jgi:pyruvate ferredoxin oxidoreductase alpha subunit